MLKDEYLETIKASGFQDISILKESAFPVELIISDPAAKAVIEGLKIPPEEVRQVAGSVLSVAVSAIKPGATG
jgi:hypothetical protein